MFFQVSISVCHRHYRLWPRSVIDTSDRWTYLWVSTGTSCRRSSPGVVPEDRVVIRFNLVLWYPIKSSRLSSRSYGHVEIQGRVMVYYVYILLSKYFLFFHFGDKFLKVFLTRVWGHTSPYWFLDVEGSEWHFSHPNSILGKRNNCSKSLRNLYLVKFSVEFFMRVFEVDNSQINRFYSLRIWPYKSYMDFFLIGELT